MFGVRQRGYRNSAFAGSVLSVDGATGAIDLTGTYASKALYIAKAADETITSNATVQNDDELLLTLAANTVYEVMVGLLITATSNVPDFKYGFTGPAGALWTGGGIGYTAAATTTGGTTTPGGAFAGISDTAFAGIVTGINNFIRVQLKVTTVATAGTFRLQWAQNTSDAASLTVTGFGNSWMSARKVA